MKKLLSIICIIFLAVFLGLFLKDAPGYVLLSYKTLIVEVSLWTSIIILILGFLLTHKIINFLKLLIHLPAHISLWLYNRKQAKTYNKMSQGLLRLAEGNFKEALRLLSSSAKYQKKPLINYLTAAKAAQELDDTNKRDEFLRLAFECSPKSGLSIGLMQANLQFDNHEYEAALATLKNLEQKYGNNKVILRQLLKCYLNVKDWYNVIKLIPDLKRYKIFSDQEIVDYEVRAARKYLDGLHKNTQILSKSYGQVIEQIDTFYYRELSRSAKSNYQVIKAYINCHVQFFGSGKNSLNHDDYLDLINTLLFLIEKNIHHDTTEEELKELFDLFGDVAFHEQHIKRLEKQLKYHEYNINLLYNLGKLAIKLENFDKAFQYLNQAQKLSPENKKVQHYIAFVLLKQGNLQQGFEVFKQSLNTV